MAMPFVLGQDPEKRRREKKNKEISKSDSVLYYLNFLLHASTTITYKASISVLVFVEIVSVVELSLVTSHQCELPLPALVISVKQIYQL